MLIKKSDNDDDDDDEKRFDFGSKVQFGVNASLEARDNKNNIKTY